MTRFRWLDATAITFLSVVLAGGCYGWVDGMNSEEGFDSTPHPGHSDMHQDRNPPGDPGDGDDDKSDPGDDGKDLCKGTTPGPSPVPRMTEREFNNTVRDLLPELSLGAMELPQDEEIGPFKANVVSGVGGNTARQYRKAAETISEKVVGNFSAVSGCEGGGQTNEVFGAEAENLEGTAGEAQPSSGVWNLWTNGHITTEFTVDNDAKYTVAVAAYGTEAGDEDPKMRVAIDGATVDVIDVGARNSSKTYTAESFVQSGTHQLRVEFTNDFYDDQSGDDRNLLVDRMAVRAPTGLAKSTDCIETFAQELASQAYRRPLTEQEKTRLTGLFRGLEMQYDAKTGVRGVVEAILQSPKFLYRSRKGVSDEEVARLTDLEMASRLSYFLWDSMPDKKLLDAARAGELHTPEQIGKQARRMLGDKRARETINDAFLEWLGVDELDETSTERSDLDAELRESMVAETRAFIDHVIWEENGSLDRMLTAPYTFVDAKTAKLYGVEPSGDGSMTKIDLSGTDRRGILTQPAILAKYGGGAAPVHRGLFVRETFFCSRPPPPPDELMNPPETVEGESDRAKAKKRLEHQQCGGCHRVMDPVGLTFDRFDDRGEARTKDSHGNSVKSTGELLATEETNGPLDGPKMLADRLSKAPEVERCFAKQWLRYALTRSIGQHDACEVQKLNNVLEESNGNIRDLLVAVTKTDAFRYRSLPDDSEGDR